MMSSGNQAYSIDGDPSSLGIGVSALKGRNLLQSEVAVFSQVEEAVRATAELERKQIQIMVIIN